MEVLKISDDVKSMSEHDNVSPILNSPGLPESVRKISGGVELLHLQNIIDNFVVPSVMSSEEKEELTETAALLIHEHVLNDATMFMDPNFHDRVTQDVTKLIEIQLESMLSGEVGEEIEDAVEQAFALFYTYIAPKRSHGDTFIRKKCNPEKMRPKVKYLESVPQPEQRTPEWYAFRYENLTASSVWKAFGTPGTVNQLIYDKCSPLDTTKYSRFSTASPMHWGHKYEPVSILWYENEYSTIVSDFGCIPHKTIPYLAASPDGINTMESSERYGRMLEVKNIVNRDITGIPKLEYWIQMQIQMEVCMLNECDFLETRFTEYEDCDDFNGDGSFTLSADGSLKGVMLYFMKGGQPFYEYAPLGASKEEFDIWEGEVMTKNEDITWMQNIYWKLAEISCVLVLRNKMWFDAGSQILAGIKETIEKEKVSGYSHRAPKKKQTSKPSVVQEPAMPSKCYINVQSLLNENIETDTSTIVKTNSPPPNSMDRVIKINTECFQDQTQSDDS